MNTEQQLNCVFCEENFDSKAELQIHFRKHGDPNFDKSTKIKNRSHNDSQNFNEKSAEDNELVGCDVCEELFPTISKAITHKHKVHPDHDAKYFCPFCGKLFTMKHLYNKHIQTNHDTQSSIEKSDFHCDSCEVMFFVPSAMLYHNKFFHRQDSEIPSIGSSKKVKLCSQEMIQIYYCTFCGEEYNNKVNLHKHMGDDHGDENQSPTDILKCPLCEAVFYHLDAYELHLMFHSSEDIYSEQNEMAETITEFSLETVPPIVEKIEEECPQEESGNAEEGMNTFLKFLMGDSTDSEIVGKVKTKKHKKHKKSKKAAITLDEFLNMNKDVFGDGLDVQGIEEVPTQVVLKKIKGKKPVNNKSKTISADINKLKKQGIIVKTKSGNNFNPNLNRFIDTKITTMANKVDDKKLSTPSASDELLSKLMRQGNSQIKIVKKSNIKADNTVQSNNDITPMFTQSTEDDIETPITDSNDIHNEIAENDREHEEDNQNLSSTNTPAENDNKIIQSTNQVTKDEIVNNADKCSNEQMHDNININNSEKSLLGNHSQDIPIEDNDDNDESPMSSPYMHNEENLLDLDLDGPGAISNLKEKNVEANCSTNAAIGALKHLSHLITIKPVKQDKSIPDTSNEFEKQITGTNIKTCFDDFNETETSPAVHVNQKSSHLNKSSEALKSLGKHLIVKSIPQNILGSSTDCKVEKIGTNTKHTSPEGNNSPSNNQIKTTSNDCYNPNLVIKEEPKGISEIHSRQMNATVKQLINKNNQNFTAVKPINTNVKIEKPMDKNMHDEIEIFNIDDSDSDDALDDETKNNKNESMDNIKGQVQLQNVLQNLGSNITIKSNQQKSTLCEIKNKTVNEESSVHNDIHTFKKVNKPSPEIQKSINLQNTLKHLGSHITIKSKNTSSINSNDDYTTFEENHDESTHMTHSDQNDSDSEMEIGKVKITEITDETNDIHNEAQNYCNTVAIVQSPEEHNSESEYHSYDEDSDIEAQIKANTLKKTECLIPKTSSHDNIKTLNKDLVIKPVNDNRINPETTPYDKKSMTTNNSNKSLAQTFGQSSQTNALNRKINTSSNEVNTVKTVKKFQTETVIQEVTTVTRTIRTVNESTNEIVQSGTPQKTIKNQIGKEYQGKTIRHLNPTVGTRVRSQGNIIRPPICTPIRSPNQIVPIRTMTNTVKPVATGMQVVRKTAPPMNSPQKPSPASKLRISPNVVNQTTIKRPLEGNSTLISGISKKSKESTIALPMSKSNMDSVEQYTASTSKSEFSSVTKVVKGKSLITQTRSEVSSTQQHLSKLSNMSGLKIMKTSTKQAMEVVEKSDVCASKRNTLDAIEKLQKQGLLVKKPRVELSENNEHDYFSESDDENYDQ